MKQAPYIRTKTYELDHIFGLMRTNVERVVLDGTPNTVNLNSLRLKCFMTKGVQCVACNLKGVFFAAEVANHKNYTPIFHLNLYALTKDAKEVLMTKDHIIPRSKKGQDSLDNLQTMCCHCNVTKGNKILSEKSPNLVMLG